MNTAWLLEAAERLDREGNHELAAEARAEAASGPVMVSRARVGYICDSCGQSVTSRKQIEKYAERLQVDWVLHRRCESA